MRLAADILVSILALIGAGGSVLPLLPGLPVIAAAALLHGLATGFSPMSPGRLLVLAGLMGLGYALDALAGAVGVQRFGGSRWGMGGAVLGGIAGLFFGLPGLLAGPLLGAVTGELLGGRDLRGSLRSGLGTVLGMLGGAVCRFALALSMAGLTLWWIWAG